MSNALSLSGLRVWVAGHRGMVGSSMLRRLASENCTILTATHRELDLTNQAATDAWMASSRPDVVVLVAAKVGGIGAHLSYPGEFIYDNLMIACNVIHAAHRANVRKLLTLGSACIYPKVTPQPIVEDALLTAPLESSNEGYAIAKIAAIKLCQMYRRQYGADFISAQPTNLYGPNDLFDLKNAHVLPALIAKVHTAKQEGRKTIEVWGSGTPTRDFLHVDDLADAAVFLLKTYSGETPLNIGTGQDVSIAELARAVARAAGWSGDLVFDRSKPDGTPRRRLDVTRMAELGWTARIGLDEGLVKTYEWYSQNDWHAARSAT